MKHLYLLRHAKSSWDLAGALDYERGLTDRGRDDCEVISELIRKRDIRPDLVLCSGARRSRKTLERVSAALPRKVPVVYDDAIYQASLANLATLLSTVDEKYKSVMMVGHNPSFHDFAVDIAESGDQLEEIAAKFPTAALAEFELKVKWESIGPDTATLVNFTAPKTLRSKA
jgi:phosphohistidine phosphatase